MGLDRDTYSVTIPLGATINMDGAAITITVMTMATAFTLGIHVDFPTAIILSLLRSPFCTVVLLVLPADPPSRSYALLPFRNF